MTELLCLHIQYTYVTNLKISILLCLFSQIGRDIFSACKNSRPAVGGLQTKLPLPLPQGVCSKPLSSTPRSPSLPARHHGLPPARAQNSLHPPPLPLTSRPLLPRLLSVPAECCPLQATKERKHSSRLPQWPPEPPPLACKPAANTAVRQAITHKPNLPPLPCLPREQNNSPRPPKKSQSFAGYDRPPPVRFRPLPPVPNEKTPPDFSLGTHCSRIHVLAAVNTVRRDAEPTVISLPSKLAPSGPPLPPDKPAFGRVHLLPATENNTVKLHNHTTGTVP